MMKRFTIFLLLVLVCSALVHAQVKDIFKRKAIEARMLKVAEWQLANPKHELYDWTNGAFYAGVFAAYETTKSKAIWKALMDMGDKNKWSPGPRFDHADDLVIAQTYIDIYRITKDKRMLQPTIDVVNRLNKETGNEVAKHGLTWWWCDALFMAPPALAKLAKTTGDRSYLDLNDKFFQQTYDLLYNKEEHLYARDASYLINEKGEGKREANGKKVFWSRGNGWVAGGLVRLLKELPKDHLTRQFYLDQYRDMAARVAELQQPDGLWRSSLLDPDSYPGGESSGSGFYIYAMAWGVNNKVLDKKKFAPIIRKAWTGLNTLVHEDGKVGWTQPIGADPRRNFTAESWEVYGAGAYLLAASEVIKLK
ncbi:MAG TPA: glycoside hydrolase family 88 protein [Pyrinomonadaceae bacterium]|jgi:unsaturated rhamnogalacturonyl hydrolase|nr:glycoside hydrolase family 88 protein [Pyrinomonadaceae bacterium]